MAQDDARWTARALPNDSCAETHRLEAQLLDHLPRYESSEVLSASESDNGYLVLKSRAHRRDVRVPFGSSLDLESFACSGHTLGIDQIATWIRYYSLDLDCACRAIKRQRLGQRPDSTPEIHAHLDEVQAVEVLRHTLDALRGYLVINRHIKWQIWRRACGFHIYTDVPVTLPTHLLFARMATSYFTNRTFIIEVPSIMPLPYSAKTPREPYLKCQDSEHRAAAGAAGSPDGTTRQQSSDLVIPPLRARHYDFFEYRAYESLAGIQDSKIVGHIVMRGPLPVEFARPGPDHDAVGLSDDTHTIYIATATKIRSSCQNRRLLVPRIVSIVIKFAFKYLAPVRDYLTHVAMSDVASMVAPIRLENRTEYDRLEPCLRARVERFMSLFNQMFARIVSTSFVPFVAETLTQGGLNLQHWVVILDLFMVEAATCADDDSDNDEAMSDDETLYLERQSSARRAADEFGPVLRAIYANALPENLVLQRFLRYYDERTRKAYGDCKWREFMDYMVWLNTYGLTALDSLPDKVELLLRRQTSCVNSAEYQAKSRDKHKDTRNSDDAELVQFGVDMCHQLGCFMFSKGSRMFYTNDSGTHYRFSKKIESMPAAPFVWTNISPKKRQEVHDTIMTHFAEYEVLHKDLTTSSPFVISTDVGVFNSLTGLYSAHTKFLRFTRFRHAVVWPLQRELCMYAEQNADIVTLYDMSDDFMRRPKQGVISDLFVHAILMPMSLQLQHIDDIDDGQLVSLLGRLDEHPTLAEASFLVEYFPMSVHYVYVVMRLLLSCDSSMLLDSSTLFVRLVNRSEPSTADWLANFSRESFEYTKHSAAVAGAPSTALDEAAVAGSYMSELLSICDGDAFTEDMGPTRELCLRAVILGMGLAKCRQYTAMAQAFGVTNDVIRRLEPRSRHSAYANFRYSTNSETCAENVARAKRIVFGTCKSRAARPQFKCFVDAMTSLAMMTYFGPKRFDELCASITANFVTVNLIKKLIIYYGKPHTGKSLMCRVIELMNSPQVGRFLDLKDPVSRSNINTRTNVLLINEAKHMSAGLIKSVTGTDGDSQKQFFNQEYELVNQQAWVIGATNDEIEYERNTTIDLAAIQRILGVETVGAHLAQSPNMGSWLEMMSANELFLGCVAPDDVVMANGVAWLTYSKYVATRRSTGAPMVDETCESTLQYQHRIRLRNYPVCRFLADIGICYEPGFNIDARELYAIVKTHINTKTYIYERVSDFISAFESNFRVRLSASMRIVSDFQKPELVQHVKSHMATLEQHGSTISEADVRSRLEYYAHETDRQNAMRYFRRINECRFDYAAHYYANVAFVTQPIPYESMNYGQYDAIGVPEALDPELAFGSNSRSCAEPASTSARGAQKQMLRARTSSASEDSAPGPSKRPRR